MAEKFAIQGLVAIFFFVLYSEAHYVRTPVGLVWSECMHKISSGSHVLDSPEGVTVIHHNGSTQKLPRCTVPRLQRTKAPNGKRDSPNDGWQVWTAFNNLNNVSFDSFLGYFNVPDAPSNWGGGIVYLFTGLQNDNWVPIDGEFPTPPGFDIIQPVLQYGGDSENGGGDYWGLASWYVTLDDGALWTDLVTVNPGDSIFGNMTRTGPTSWFIGGTVQASGASTSFTVTKDRLSSQPWAYCTLEVYDIDDCAGSFPPSTSPIKFTQLALYDQGTHKVTPQWQSLTNPDDHCDATVQVLDPSTVVINF